MFVQIFMIRKIVIFLNCWKVCIIIVLFINNYVACFYFENVDSEFVMYIIIG